MQPSGFPNFKSQKKYRSSIPQKHQN